MTCASQQQLLPNLFIRSCSTQSETQLNNSELHKHPPTNLAIFDFSFYSIVFVTTGPGPFVMKSMDLLRVKLKGATHTVYQGIVYCYTQ